ncbi:MAG: thioredoxin domain-containing protein, partial [Bacteroidota bacterium]
KFYSTHCYEETCRFVLLRAPTDFLPPRSVCLLPFLSFFLLCHHFHTGNAKSLDAVTTTLDAMAAGGIYDQLAGGFARYSTDADWLVPHFEKMLYDNAQLVSLYAHAYQLTGKERYAEVIRQTLDFIDHDLTDETGVFYASLDADTEGEEGTTYVWSLAEIETALGVETAASFAATYGVTRRGNWEGQNILTLNGEGMLAAREKLLALRRQRPQPRLDDKALTAWNSLMISGYVDAYRALGEPAYRERAVRAADFLWANVRQADGRLDRNYKGGRSTINAFLDDYALLAQAYVDLYQITFAEQWLTRARELLTYADAHFYDVETGLYRYTSDLDAPLVSGNVPVTDKVIPAGNSVMARVRHQLGTLLAEDELAASARAMLGLLQDKLAEAGPRFYANWASLYLDLLEPTYEVAILGADAGAKRDSLGTNYLPHALLLGGEVEGGLALLRNKLDPERTMIYVCLEKVCQLPVTEVEQALQQLTFQ